MKAKAERIGRAVDEAARKLAEYRKAEARLVFLAQIGEPRSAAPVAGTVSLDGTWRFPGKCAVAFVRPGDGRDPVVSFADIGKEGDE